MLHGQPSASSAPGLGCWETADLLLVPFVTSPAPPTPTPFPYTTLFRSGPKQQPGLVLTGDNASGGYVIQRWDGTGHFSWLHVSAPEMSTNGAPSEPKDDANVLADLGAVPNPNDSYHISATVDRTGPHPA